MTLFKSLSICSNALMLQGDNVGFLRSWEVAVIVWTVNSETWHSVIHGIVHRSILPNLLLTLH